RDHLLRLHVDHALPHVDLDDALDHRHQEREPGVDGVAIAPEPEDQSLLVLRDDARRSRQGDERDEQNDDEQQESELRHGYLTWSVTPSTPATVTRSPGSRDRGESAGTL